MLLTFKSKAQMRLYHPLENFEIWPKDTFSFCPKCALDSFELLLNNDLEHYIRCKVCGSLWIVPCLSLQKNPAEAALV